MQIDISVVVPTCGRKGRLKRCLNSLFNQSYTKEKLELIVVDDRANDKLAKMLEDLKEKHSQIRYVAQSRKGPAAARNLGVRSSLGEIVAFVDDDCVVDKDWVRLMIETHHTHPAIVAVGGDTSSYSQKISLLVSQFLSTGSIETNINGEKETIFFPTCNVSFKKQIFDRYKFNGKFPLPGGEDLEFFWRLFKDGYRFIWNKNIKVIHYRDDTFYSFIKQAYIYGRGNFLVQHIHKDHPLLKELKVGKASFWFATLINIIKIPRFSYLLGRKLIQKNNIRNAYRKLCIYSYFFLHKIPYILGNIAEFFRLRRERSIRDRQPNASPRLLILDITHSCNISCRICDIWKTAKSERDIDTFYVKKTLSQAKNLGIKEIALSGGESLMRKDIFELFNYAESIKIRNLGVLTNGILIESLIDRLKPYLINNTITLIVSLDSLAPHIHNYIRDSGIAWQKSVRGLELLALLKRDNPQINFAVITIILNQNLEELPDLAMFIKSLAVNSLQFQVLLSNNLRMAQRKGSDFWVSPDRLGILDETIGRLIAIKQREPLFIKNSIDNLSFVKRYFRGTLSCEDVRCVSADRTVLISNQGKSTTCFSAYGDIKKQDLGVIFRNQKIIRAQEEVKKCPSPCLLPCFCDL